MDYTDGGTVTVGFFFTKTAIISLKCSYNVGLNGIRGWNNILFLSRANYCTHFHS